MSEARQRWVLVLGVSSGFGAAIARAFAAEGVGILGVHLDRRGALPAVEALQEDLRQSGVPVHFFNENAASDDRRAAMVESIAELVGGGTIDVLVHSLAFGTLLPMVAEAGGRAVSRRQLEMTMDVMAHSLVYWVQDLVNRDLLGRGGRVYAMTSSGSHRVLPQYGPVSAAKSALESHIRQLAVELAPRGITANALMAGVTDTPALRKIPGNERLLAQAQQQNPSGRLTTPDDVAACVVALAAAGTAWMTGNVIRIDGGEDISA